MSKYPKAKYKAAASVGEGDMKPYEQERHAYISTTVFDEKEEKALGKGWADHPNELAAVPEEPKRGPGRPPKEDKPSPATI
jgi:hypothetical protein